MHTRKNTLPRRISDSSCPNCTLVPQPTLSHSPTGPHLHNSPITPMSHYIAHTILLYTTLLCPAVLHSHPITNSTLMSHSLTPMSLSTTLQSHSPHAPVSHSCVSKLYTLFSHPYNPQFSGQEPSGNLKANNASSSPKSW